MGYHGYVSENVSACLTDVRDPLAAIAILQTILEALCLSGKLFLLFSL